MKKYDLMKDLVDSENMNIVGKELMQALTNALKQYEWRQRSERIKAGIREAKLRKANMAE